MICILKIEAGELKGWILASDVNEARRKAEGAWQTELADALRRIEAPPKGKTILPGGHTMLVE